MVEFPIINSGDNYSAWSVNFNQKGIESTNATTQEMVIQQKFNKLKQDFEKDPGNGEQLVNNFINEILNNSNIIDQVRDVMTYKFNGHNRSEAMDFGVAKAMELLRKPLLDQASPYPLSGTETALLNTIEEKLRMEFIPSSISLGR